MAGLGAAVGTADSALPAVGAVTQQHAQLAQLTSYSWNVFRYMGDYLHLFGVVMLLFTILKNKACTGLSRSTQILYFMIFASRYLDLFDHSQTAYLVFFKLTYVITSVIALGLFAYYDKTYERNKDTCSLVIIFMPCLTASILLSNEYSALEMLWTFSQFLEGFAMVPQYIFCYRDRQASDMGVLFYVLSLGGYRVFYACNWIYKKIVMPQYHDLQSWIGGIIEIIFFTDFLLSRFTGASVLRAIVLKVDEKINDIQESVELKVLGSSRRERYNEENGSELRQRRGKGAEAELASLEV